MLQSENRSEVPPTTSVTAKLLPASTFYSLPLRCDVIIDLVQVEDFLDDHFRWREAADESRVGADELTLCAARAGCRVDARAALKRADGRAVVGGEHA